LGAKPFFILTLPRSRSKWLSAFLSYKGAIVGHDTAVNCDSVGDFVAAVSMMRGTVETGAMIAWQALVLKFPESKFIAVRRPVDDVMISLQRCGVQVPYTELRERAKMLEDFSYYPGVKSCSYEDLKSQWVCRDIFETCLGVPFDPDWYAKLAATNIQIDIKACMALLRNRASMLSKLKAELATCS
jgi:hypothetical protein